MFSVKPPNQERNHLQMALQKKGWATDKRILIYFRTRLGWNFWKWNNRS